MFAPARFVDNGGGGGFQRRNSGSEQTSARDLSDIDVCYSALVPYPPLVGEKMIVPCYCCRLQTR